jgi:hypothetical protein
MRKDIDDDTQGYLSDQPKRQWVGLTDEDKHEIELRAGITEDDDGYIVSQVFKLTEAKLKEKNTDAVLKTGVGKPGDFV